MKQPAVVETKKDSQASRALKSLKTDTKAPHVESGTRRRQSATVPICDIEGTNCQEIPTFARFGATRPSRCSQHKMPPMVKVSLVQPSQSKKSDKNVLGKNLQLKTLLCPQLTFWKNVPSHPPTEVLLGNRWVTFSENRPVQPKLTFETKKHASRGQHIRIKHKMTTVFLFCVQITQKKKKNRTRNIHL